MTLPQSRYPTVESRALFVRETLRRVEAIPGVETAGAANYLPAQGIYSMQTFEAEGQPVPAGERPSPRNGG